MTAPATTLERPPQNVVSSIFSSTDDLGALFRVLPASVVAALGGRCHDLEEIKMRQHRPLFVNWGGRYVALDLIVTPEDVQAVVDYIGGFRADGRAGIAGTVHRISELRDRFGATCGITVRIGRFTVGVAEPLRPLLSGNTKALKILLIGPPGVGKSTLLRDMVRIISGNVLCKCVVVDTSNEIAGDGDRPHPGIGQADVLPVPSPDEQPEIIRRAIANHGAEIVVVDEIGYHSDALVLQVMGKRGTGLIATAHGVTVQDVAFNPALNPVLGEPRPDGSRQSPSVFTTAIEIQHKGVYRVYHDLDATLDAVRRGQDVSPETFKLE